ncbi:hypothetical protein PVAG01_00326 [Phlyctema vagabunda]|uniref:Uncharacterized protein n=1 Tax=Phlyctema vagabunda TaxID=108571 RepID=A0ABR4PUI6_9HELO
MPIVRRFSLTNCAIGTTALLFQIFVLYPWHKQLDDDFAQLRLQNERVLALLGEREAKLSPTLSQVRAVEAAKGK